MLAGRLEIFPMLLLFSKSTWNIQSKKLRIKDNVISDDGIKEDLSQKD
jgi:Trk-type K+ transport system membrane component